MVYNDGDISTYSSVKQYGCFPVVSFKSSAMNENVNDIQQTTNLRRINIWTVEHFLLIFQSQVIIITIYLHKIKLRQY